MNEPYAELEPAQPTRERQVLLLPIVVLLTLLAAVIGGAALLGGDDEPDPIELLGSAPDAARDAGTARMTMTMTMGSGEFDIDATGEGLIDFRSGAQTFEMSMFGISFELRMVDAVLYMRLPAIGRPAGLDAEWVGLPIVAAEGSNPFSTPSATGMIDSLRGMSDEIEELGEDDIDGVAVTGYRVSIDLETAIDALPEGEREDAEIALRQMRAMGMTRWPMEVWLNDAGLPVRMVMDLEIAGAGGLRMQIDYVDFGVDVDIVSPPAAETHMVDGIGELNDLLGIAA